MLSSNRFAKLLGVKLFANAGLDVWRCDGSAAAVFGETQAPSYTVIEVFDVSNVKIALVYRESAQPGSDEGICMSERGTAVDDLIQASS